MYQDGGKPVASWAMQLEDEAKQQAMNLSRLPFAFHHIALMPDAHSGYGMPIGGVLATEGVIIPNAVGVDIGCGMIALQTNLTDITVEQVKQIIGATRKVIPVGFNKHKEKQEMEIVNQRYTITVYNELDNARKSLGTLGGGNHFIEIQRGSDGFIWLTIHSGSRNLGKKVCDYYNSMAKAVNSQYYSSVTSDLDLAFLPVNTELGAEYIQDMTFCLDYAQANRELMMTRLLEVFNSVTGGEEVKRINIHHNYASLEHHYGRNVWVHRKGAVNAQKGKLGIIPGSMGTASYIVSGLGNPLSFNSSSHGAGRIMSRKKAMKTISLEDAKSAMYGIVFDGFESGGCLDEAPQAYKDIDTVMEAQKDLTEIIVKLEPLGVMKG